MDEKKTNRLGKAGYILSIFAFVGMWIGIFTEFSMLFVAIYYLILIAILLATLFLLLASEGFKKWINGGEMLANISATLYQISIYIISATMFLSILAITFLSIAKGCKHRTLGLVFSIISLIVSIISFALFFLIKF